MSNLKKDKLSSVKWQQFFTPLKFLEMFLINAEGAQSTCAYCHEDIFLDVLIGGGVTDWSTEDGDFGCPDSPESETVDGVLECAGHMPIKRTFRGGRWK